MTQRSRHRVAVAAATVLGIVIAKLLSGRKLRRRPGELPGAKARKRVVEVKQVIRVDRQPDEVYAFWHDLENLPRLMPHLESVEITGQGRSHWKMRAPAGRTVEWDALIIDDQPNRRIAWETAAGSDVDHSGSVGFHSPAIGGTEVRLELRYAPPAGRLGSALARLLGEEPERQIETALHAFKSVLERGDRSARPLLLSSDGP
ncbi:MAG TPA: SRPBCC family protein [Gemmatimonadales bacterium]|jgi:uncharacterized membrane protein